MNNYYIYFHKNPQTLELFYVGLGSHDLKKKYIRSENKSGRNQHWKNYVKKHGLPIIEIIHDNITQEEACKLEIEYILKFGRKHFENYGILVNESLGGQGGKQGIIVSDKTKLKQSNKLKGKPKPEGFGKKISEKLNGKSRPIIKISNQKHYILGSERNNKISQKLKGRKVDWTGDHIVQYDLNMNFIQEWPSIRQAGLKLRNNSGESIRRCVIGEQKTAYGYIWKYK